MSVSDLISVLTTVKDVFTALNDAPDEYADLRREVELLNADYEDLQKLWEQIDPTDVNPHLLRAARRIRFHTEKFRPTKQKLDFLVEKYRSLDGNTDSYGFRDFLRQARFADLDLDRMYRSLQLHRDAMNSVRHDLSSNISIDLFKGQRQVLREVQSQTQQLQDLRKHLVSEFSKCHGRRQSILEPENPLSSRASRKEVIDEVAKNPMSAGLPRSTIESGVTDAAMEAQLREVIEEHIRSRLKVGESTSYGFGDVSPTAVTDIKRKASGLGVSTAYFDKTNLNTMFSSIAGPVQPQIATTESRPEPKGRARSDLTSTIEKNTTRSWDSNGIPDRSVNRTVTAELPPRPQLKKLETQQYGVLRALRVSPIVTMSSPVRDDDKYIVVPPYYPTQQGLRPALRGYSKTAPTTPTRQQFDLADGKEIRSASASKAPQRDNVPTLPEYRDYHDYLNQHLLLATHSNEDTRTLRGLVTKVDGEVLSMDEVCIETSGRCTSHKCRDELVNAAEYRLIEIIPPPKKTYHDDRGHEACGSDFRHSGVRESGVGGSDAIPDKPHDGIVENDDEFEDGIKLAEALEDFQPASRKFCAFLAGDMIEVTNTSGKMWRGRNTNDIQQEGDFPSQFVRLFNDEKTGDDEFGHDHDFLSALWSDCNDLGLSDDYHTEKKVLFVDDYADIRAVAAKCALLRLKNKLKMGGYEDLVRLLPQVHYAGVLLTTDPHSFPEDTPPNDILMSVMFGPSRRKDPIAIELDDGGSTALTREDFYDHTHIVCLDLEIFHQVCALKEDYGIQDCPALTTVLGHFIDSRGRLEPKGIKDPLLGSKFRTERQRMKSCYAKTEEYMKVWAQEYLRWNVPGVTT